MYNKVMNKNKSNAQAKRLAGEGQSLESEVNEVSCKGEQPGNRPVRFSALVRRLFNNLKYHSKEIWGMVRDDPNFTP